MSWAWNAGREEGRRGFGEGDASHLFPRPKVLKINPTHSYAGQSGRTERYQSPITPNYSPPQQINPKQKQPTKISLISLKSNVLQTSQCFIKINLKSTADIPKAAHSGFVSASRRSSSNWHRYSTTVKGSGRLPFFRWSLRSVRGMLSGLPPGKRRGTMGDPVWPRNRLTLLAHLNSAWGLECEKVQGPPGARAGAGGEGCLLGPQPRGLTPPKGE